MTKDQKQPGWNRGPRASISSGKMSVAVLAAVLVLLLPAAGHAQPSPQPNQAAAGNAPQSFPETPQPQNNAPPSALPQPSSSPRPSPPPAEHTTPLPPATDSADDSTAASPAPPPPQSPITTAKPGSIPSGPGSPREQLFTLTRNVNFVLVPVTVKTRSGKLVDDLVARDFAVYEDGAKQNLTFFTSDPFPLSAAVVLDIAVSNSTWRKIRDTLPALVGAFSQYDEIAVFTYGNTVRRVQGFTGINAVLLADSLRKLKNETGSGEGAAVAMGPLSPSASPSTSGLPSTLPPQMNPSGRLSYVLNDAILAAARELSTRPPTRRKIVFVVSDGREYGSANNFDDVLRVLLTYQVGVYGIGVGSAGVPIYRQLDKIHIPTQGYTDILPKYVSATGGQMFPELSQRAIEEAYAQVTEEARNQYTIGYNTPSPTSAQYRSIEVRVDRPDLKVYARDGYYPLPPGK